MFDRYNIGFTRGEIPAPTTPTAAQALYAASALATGLLKSAYIGAMWQVSQHSGKLGRPMVLESTLAALADIRDMGHTPAVVNALIAAEACIRRLDAGRFPDCAQLLEISIARTDSITACRRPA